MKSSHVVLLLLACASLLTTLSFSSDPVPNLRRPSPFRPLCVSQIALANYACTSVIPGLPFGNNQPVPATTATTMLEPSDILYTDVEHDDEDDESSGGGEEGQTGSSSGGSSSSGGGGGSSTQKRPRHTPPRREHEHENVHDGDGHNSAATRHRQHRGGGHGHRHHGRRNSPSPRDRDDDDDDDDDHKDGDDNEGGDHDDDDDDEGDDDDDDDGELPPMTPAENNCCKWVRDVDDECVCELLMRLPTFLARPYHEYTITVSEWCKVSYSCGGRPRP